MQEDQKNLSPLLRSIGGLDFDRTNIFQKHRFDSFGIKNDFRQLNQIPDKNVDDYVPNFEDERDE